MDLSGIIFVVLALAWALYLIPKALAHHDEIARTRSIDRFSTAMRVLARREPASHGDTRLVVTPARPNTPRVLLPTKRVAAVDAVVASSVAPLNEVQRPTQRPASQGVAARVAARRRRRILTFLVLVTLAVGGAAWFAYLPWWSVSISAGLAVAYLFVCRHQVRGELRTGTQTETQRGTRTGDPVEPPRPAARVELAYGLPQTPRLIEPVETTRPVLPERLPEQATTAEAVIEATGAQAGSLWDPLPITLPTYVGKPRAARTVRTIDLSQPNTWSSGRSEADSRLVEEAASAREPADKAADDQRAVGS